jgi:two-component system, NarL family, nitrate/nitrite response regulator NarL
VVGQPDVILIARNELLREGLRRLIAEHFLSVVGSVPTPDLMPDADTSLSTIPPVCLLIVDGPPDEDAELCRRVRAKRPTMPLVIMGDDSRAEDILRFFDLGADGYVPNSISCERLIGSLTLAGLGEKVVPSSLVTSLSSLVDRGAHQTWEARTAAHNLSAREVSILRCLINGDSNKSIAKQLDVSEAAVKMSVKTVLRKLRVVNRPQAAIWALNGGRQQ